MAQTELSSTADATWAFEVLNTLAQRNFRDGLWDWSDDFSDRFLSSVWWEGGLEGSPGEYILDESVAFDQPHRRYYLLQAQEFAVSRRIRPSIDTTQNVFGTGLDRATFRDSVDIYVKIDMRIPAEAPVGSEAWIGVRSEVNASGGLFQYQVSLVKQDENTTLIRVAPRTQTDRTTIYEGVVQGTPDGWHEIIILTLDDRMAFFLDGLLVTSVRDVSLYGGSLAIGVEPNSLAHFDDLIFRDTSVRE
ncbi:MAG: hypothetical protein HC915_11140 [Anaerolineae bacterium]|nr:hypothetical protein [Anaerolineae bacterium]